MEQQPFTPINGTNIDPNTFRRVWDRVMPDQSGSPLAVDIPAAEDVLEPVASSTQLPPVPTCPAAGQNLPPVPVCPVEPAEPEPPVQPAPPAQPEPSEPVQPSQPEDAPLCLGEQSRPYTQRLEELMALAQTGIAAGQLLCRRAGGSCGKALAALTADHRRAFKQLSAAYFLITGERFRPACEAVSLPASLPLALREQFVREQQWERACRQAAQETEDPCLEQLYLELAQDGALHTGVIRSLLEQM